MFGCDSSMLWNMVGLVCSVVVELLVCVSCRNWLSLVEILMLLCCVSLVDSEW